MPSKSYSCKGVPRHWSSQLVEKGIRKKRKKKSFEQELNRNIRRTGLVDKKAEPKALLDTRPMIAHRARCPHSARRGY